MLKLQSILVPVDLTGGSRYAYSIARDLAEKFHAAIHVLYVTPTAGPFEMLFRQMGEGENAAMSEEHERSVLEALERDYAGYDPIKHIHRKGTSVAETVLAYADECEIDMIVMATRGHRGLEHPVLGGVTGDIVRHTTRPVLTVRTRSDERVDFGGFRRVAAAVDFAGESREVVRAAKQIASSYGASVTILFVAEEHQVPVFSDTGLISVMTLKVDEEIAARAADALKQLDEETGSSDLERDHVVLRGKPSREIVRYAEESGVDLIVIGRRGHSPHEGLLLGTVTEHVVRRSSCPVLTFGQAEEE